MANKEYMNAVDRVCLNCAFGEETCPVRRTVDLSRINEKKSDLTNHILVQIHICPFLDESGVNFDECSGFGNSRCRECIYKNTDKLSK